MLGVYIYIERVFYKEEATYSIANHKVGIPLSSLAGRKGAGGCPMQHAKWCRGNLLYKKERGLRRVLCYEGLLKETPDAAWQMAPRAALI
jgi:hypothetical protein